MQNKITQSDLILNKNGFLKKSGWSYNNLLFYDKALVKDNLSLLTQRDSYFISNEECVLYLTITERGKKAFLTIIFIDFKRSVVVSQTYAKPKFSGEVIMSKSSTEGITLFKTSDCKVRIERKNRGALIKGSIRNFNGNNMKIDLNLMETENLTLSTAKNFSKKSSFFVYKNYIPLLRADGEITFSGNDYYFDGQDTVASLNWIRGTIPNNTDVKSLYINDLSENGMAMCLSSDFGNTEKCNDNFIICNSNFLKLDDVEIDCQNDTLGLWDFYSEHQGINLTFSPFKFKKKALFFVFENRILILGKALCNFGLSSGIWQNKKDHLAFLEIEVF